MDDLISHAAENNSTTNLTNLSNGIKHGQLFGMQILNGYYLTWIELSTALSGFTINGVVISAIALGSIVTSRGYFFGLLNLYLGQGLLCLLSIMASAFPLLQHFNNSSCSDQYASCYNLKSNWWCQFMHDTSTAVFCGVCITGVAAISWSQWWALNIWASHFQVPTDYRVAQAVAGVKWSITLLFTIWINAYQLTRAGLSATPADDHARSVAIYARLYSLCLSVSTVWLLFSSFTGIPAVTGHMTARASHTNVSNHHECRDADCVCSDSADNLSAEGTPGDASANAGSVQKKTSSNIPTIIADVITDDLVKRPTPHDCQGHITPSSCSTDLVIPSRLHPCLSEGTLSSWPSLDHSRQGNSLYSADFSTASLASSTTHGPKLSGERLHKRLQQLNNIRRVPPADDEESESRQVKPTAPKRKKRRPTKKMKSVIRLQWKWPSRVQLVTITAFVLLYSPPVCLLVAGIYSPSYVSTLLSIYRVFLNITCCVNPIFHRLCHPRLRITPRGCRTKIRPVTSGGSIPPPTKMT